MKVSLHRQALFELHPCHIFSALPGTAAAILCALFVTLIAGCGTTSSFSGPGGWIVTEGPRSGPSRIFLARGVIFQATSEAANVKCGPFNMPPQSAEFYGVTHDSEHCSVGIPTAGSNTGARAMEVSTLRLSAETVGKPLTFQGGSKTSRHFEAKVLNEPKFNAALAVWRAKLAGRDTSEGLPAGEFDSSAIK